MSEAHARAEEVARASYGKLVSLLTSVSKDMAAAEDALAEAFRKALEIWPEKGIPNNPEGWLLTVSRNAIRDRFKSAAFRTKADIDSDEIMNIAIQEIDPEAIPDERLKLLFVCAHPAIDANIRTPLMLQTVLGVEAADIGTAFLVPASAMAQRLVRAKRKIKNAGIPFAIPDQDKMPERLESVLEAIYGAYTVDWDTDSSENDGDDLSREALFLANLLVDLLPEEAEVLGLAALLTFSVAREGARLQDDGTFVPLFKQDTLKWEEKLIARAENLLARAETKGNIGRFQLEAAIQAVHSHRMRSDQTDWKALAFLYEGLLSFLPSVGAATARAAAIGMAYGGEAGLDALSQIDPKLIETFQPAWAVRAHLLEISGKKKSAKVAYKKAIDLCTHIGMRRYLEQQMATL